MKQTICQVIICTSLLLLNCNQETKLNVLHFDDFAHYIDQFNKGDNELYIQHIPNTAAKAFLEKNIPLIDIPDKELEKIYYFRWWTYRKHIKSTADGFVITEFLPDVPWAGKHNTINCPAAHHIYEGRWLRDHSFTEDYIHFWLNDAGDGVRNYSFWVADAMLAYSKVNRQDAFIKTQLPLLVGNYTAWEQDRRDDPERLFWQIDDRDGMEFGASGRIINQGKQQGSTAAIRPTINSYMYGDAMAITTLAGLIDKQHIAVNFQQKADEIKNLVQQRLWHDSLSFFTVMPQEYTDETKPLSIRELIGYVPWYFNLPDDRPEYAMAWKYLMGSTGFYAPHGLTVCEQSHPYFQISYEGHECQWNGPSWPFATTQTLKALANFLTNYQHNKTVSGTDYYQLLKQYANKSSDQA